MNRPWGPPREAADGTVYPRVRGVLRAELRGLPDEAVDTIFARSGLDAEQAENFLQTLAGIGSQILPIAGSALGTIFGGPAGTAIGGALGGMAGRALGGLAGRPQPAGQAPQQQAQQPQQQAQAQPSQQLMQLLSRPEVMRALMSMSVGSAGAPTVPVAGSPVPVSAIANAISHLAGEAASQFESRTRDVISDRYVEDAGLRPDEASPGARAEAILHLFAVQDAVRARRRGNGLAEHYEAAIWGEAPYEGHEYE
jgi:hypothetical protein